MNYERMIPEEVVKPFKKYYENKLAGKVLDTEKQFDISPEQEKIIENNYTVFKDALKRMIILNLRAKIDNRAKSSAYEMGSICTKLYASIYEKLPISRQNQAIADMDSELEKTGREHGVDISGYLAGFKGELGGLVLCQGLGLTLTFPKLNEDLKMKTDWKATDENGKKYLIQVKTYSLKKGVERTGNMPPPVITDITTKRNLEIFINDVAANVETISEQEQKRKNEIITEASLVRDNALVSGSTPIMCLLGSPESDNSDIIPATSRPTPLVQTQAAQEWEQISKNSP